MLEENCCKCPSGSLNSHTLFSHYLWQSEWWTAKAWRQQNEAKTKQHDYRQNNSLRTAEIWNATRMEGMFEGLTCKCLYGYRLLTGAFWGGVCCCIYLHSCLDEFMHNEGRIKEKVERNSMRSGGKKKAACKNDVVCRSEFAFYIAAVTPKS